MRSRRGRRLRTQNGLAWIRERSEGPLSLTLPDDLLLPHPRDTITIADARTTADVDTARADVVALRSGSITLLRVLPPEAAPGYVSCHFDEGSVYPADTLVALVQQARDAIEIYPDARLALFAHTRASGSVDDDKALSDRRARFVHVVLTADLAALQSTVDEDAWQETHDPCRLRRRRGRTSTSSPMLRPWMRVSPPEVIDDKDGIPRPQGAEYDLGAYEHRP